MARKQSSKTTTQPALSDRSAPIEMSPDAFRAAGHALVDRVAEFMATLPARPVAPGKKPRAVRQALGDAGLPQTGADPQALLAEAADLLFDHSVFNGHPRFWGFISGAGAPVGALADLLAASVNPNMGAWGLAPMAVEIEAQTVRWIAEMLGYPTTCGGLLVSGGNMANFVGVLAGRKAQATWDVRASGVSAGAGKPRLYASRETHTWVQKAADLFGFGTDAIRWIATDERQRMRVDDLRRQIAADRAAGDLPMIVVGTAGSVSTGAVDPLPAIATVCREEHLWFHVDGAYGGFAALLAGKDAALGVPDDLHGIAEADSVAVDPHKWLYAPLEAGCTLVRDPEALRAAFSFHPAYYHMGDFEDAPVIDYHEYGPQNSRGFRALKVWLQLRQVGRAGYERMIGDDIRLAQTLWRRIGATPELEAHTHDLSINTFRYIPADLAPGTAAVDAYLNELNTALLDTLQKGGEVYVSNAVINEVFLLRACIVNFRTSLADIEALPEVVTRAGCALDTAMRLAALRAP